MNAGGDGCGVRLVEERDRGPFGGDFEVGSEFARFGFNRVRGILDPLFILGDDDLHDDAQAMAARRLRGNGAAYGAAADAAAHAAAALPDLLIVNPDARVFDFDSPVRGALAGHDEA